MEIQINYYLDVISSWCYWAEPAWGELKRRYSGQVEFHWQIALLGPDGLPASKDQENWFYRRSGTVTNSPYMLKSDWLDPGLNEYLAPNCVALAARDLGATDDQVRLALAQAALREGRPVGRWDESARIAAQAASLAPGELLERAKSREIEEMARQTTAQFHALQVTQRPAFVLDSSIGDRVVFSGFWRLEPLVAAIESMRADVAAYASWKAHFGDPPNR